MSPLKAAAIFVLLTGCSLHEVDGNPRPASEAGAAYSLSGEQADALKTGWYESLGSAELSGLIGLALKNNMDVRQAVARLEQAASVTRRDRAELLPNLDLEADSAREWEEGDEQESFSRGGLSLSWEIDAFNRLGAAAMADSFGEKAAAEDVDAVRLSLGAEVAEAWFGAVAQQQQLNLLRKQTLTDEKLLDLIEQRLEAGVGTNVEVLQQKSQLAENESLIPPAEAALRVYENRLDVLTGAAPDGSDRTGPDSDYADIGRLPKLGIPSDLLLNRPDLRAMKNRLIAADAGIGAAIADRLPRLTLTGSHLYADGPAAAADHATTLLGGIVQPLLDWGRRKAEVERNKALYSENLSAFTQAYLEAVEDVENALYRENRQREYITRLEAQRGILEQTLSAAEAVYRQGESDYLPVLDAVQNLRRVERDLVGQRLALVLFRIELFRALGAPVSAPQGDDVKRDRS